MVLLLIQAAPHVGAADKEVRDFAVTVDRKPAGRYSMAITQQTDGSQTVEGTADVQVSHLVFKYTYSYRGTEVWRDGRLRSLNSNSNDNGKQFTVICTSEANGLRVQANGLQHISRPDVWTTTYWHSPDPRFANHSIPLLDADTGKDITSVLQYLGPERVTVMGRMQDSTHYHIAGGGLQVDVWYDGHGRLIRENSLEDGHRTVFELTSIH
jgi:hypothetical protein